MYITALFHKFTIFIKYGKNLVSCSMYVYVSRLKCILEQLVFKQLLIYSNILNKYSTHISLYACVACFCKCKQAITCIM